MKKTKEKILDTAHALFNEHGVAAVSLRQIASSMNISHGNLMYHFKDKKAIVAQLHSRILAEAIKINSTVDEHFTLSTLKQITQQGFEILYTYRFFMLDLNLIMQSDRELHATFKDIETLRADMYQKVIELFVEKGLFRQAVYEGEYEYLIKHIRIYSDFWVTSAAIYETNEPNVVIEQYTDLFMHLFYPYLTESGRVAFVR